MVQAHGYPLFVRSVAGALTLFFHGLASASAANLLAAARHQVSTGPPRTSLLQRHREQGPPANATLLHSAPQDAPNDVVFELLGSGDNVALEERTYEPRPAALAAIAAAKARGDDDGQRKNRSSLSTLGMPSGGKQVSEQGRVFLLFMTVSGLERPELWDAFLSSAPENEGLYRAFIHCVWGNVCEMHNSRLPQLTVVPTVKSVYCEDLVSPMVQLLKYALKESTSLADKFVFLSESTLPVKPLKDIHATLTAETGSDFCIEPSTSWLDLRYHGVQPASLVKHGQWVTLSQHHALLLTQRWPHLQKGTGGAWAVPVPPNTSNSVGTPSWHVTAGSNISASLGANATASFGALPGNIRLCTDEWFLFAALFGAIMHHGQPNVTLPSLANPMLFLKGAEAMQPQGVCHTFVFWNSERPETKSLAEDLLRDRPLTRFSCYPQCTTTHPAEFQALSDRGVDILRRSPFLFVRKFAQGVMSEQQFKKYILVS